MEKLKENTKQFEGEPGVTIIEVTEDNKEMLLGLRAVIDKDFNYDGLENEIEGYADQDRSDRKAFITLESGHPIGYVEVILDNEDLEELSPSEQYIKDHDIDQSELATLSRIGFIEEKRGGGLGTKLIEKAKSFAKENGKSGIWTDYLTAKEKLVDFYEKNGFKQVGNDYLDKKKNKQRRVAVCRF